MRTTLSADAISGLSSRLAGAQRSFATRFPGDSLARQPVHTVYGGAHLFSAETPLKLGAIAQKLLAEYAPDAAMLARALGRDAGAFEEVYPRVVEKLRCEPVEDYRIDFEDGYGNRPDFEEDTHAATTAVEVAKALSQGTLPPFFGIRVKPFTAELTRRAVRTLDIFLSTLAEHSKGALPPDFVVTLPKVTLPEQVSLLANLCERLEPALGFAKDALRVEVMVETTQSLVNACGELALPRFVDAARGRLVAAHFGTYDYTAALGITAPHQRMTHPACDFAKHVMQIALAGTGIWLSDGATTLMPVAPHKPASPGAALTEAQRRGNEAVVHRAWRRHFDDIQHSLDGGFYQGWDLHPGQLPTRFAAVYSFFLGGFQATAERLKNFIARAAQATLHGAVFDDAATGQGLLNYVLRGLACGALSEAQVVTAGLSADELRTRSFLAIAALRSTRPALEKGSDV